jgi:hypothetical protein
VTGRRERRRKQLLDDRKESERILEIERASTTSHCVQMSFWKGEVPVVKADHGMNWRLHTLPLITRGYMGSEFRGEYLYLVGGSNSSLEKTVHRGV